MCHLGPWQTLFYLILSLYSLSHFYFDLFHKHFKTKAARKSCSPARFYFLLLNGIAARVETKAKLSWTPQDVKCPDFSDTSCMFYSL